MPARSKPLEPVGGFGSGRRGPGFFEGSWACAGKLRLARPGDIAQTEIKVVRQARVKILNIISPARLLFFYLCSDSVDESIGFGSSGVVSEVTSAFRSASVGFW